MNKKPGLKLPSISTSTDEFVSSPTRKVALANKQFCKLLIQRKEVQNEETVQMLAHSIRDLVKQKHDKIVEFIFCF